VVGLSGVSASIGTVASPHEIADAAISLGQSIISIAAEYGSVGSGAFGPGSPIPPPEVVGGADVGGVVVVGAAEVGGSGDKSIESKTLASEHEVDASANNSTTVVNRDLTRVGRSPDVGPHESKTILPIQSATRAGFSTPSISTVIVRVELIADPLSSTLFTKL